MDSSDFFKGHCSICKEPFEICLISECMDDIDMVECEEEVHALCKKHIKDFDPAMMLDENEEFLKKEYCPLCNGTIKKEPIEQSILDMEKFPLTNLQKNMVKYLHENIDGLTKFLK